jgi:hypothetical protein
MASPTPWHPVRPEITDPDLAPPLIRHPAAGAIGPAAGPAGLPESGSPSGKGGFFKEHKFAIIIAVIVLLVVVVVLFMYMTKRGDKKKKPSDDGDPTPPGSGPEDVNMEELARLRDMRRQTRGMGPMPPYGNFEGMPPMSPHGQPMSPHGQPMPPQGQPMPPQGQPMPPQGQLMPPQGQPMPPQGRGMSPPGRPAGQWGPQYPPPQQYPQRGAGAGPAPQYAGPAPQYAGPAGPAPQYAGPAGPAPQHAGPAGPAPRQGGDRGGGAGPRPGRQGAGAARGRAYVAPDGAPTPSDADMDALVSSLDDEVAAGS